LEAVFLVALVPAREAAMGFLHRVAQEQPGKEMPGATMALAILAAQEVVRA
jgi:hypothetical protein